MRELKHDHLFTPPKGVRIIVFPVVGETWAKGATQTTPMEKGYAYLARCKWPHLADNIGVMTWSLGRGVVPLTTERKITGADGKTHSRIFWPALKGKITPQFHLVAMPTRRFKEERMDLEYLVHQVRMLVNICDEKCSWLKTGDIILPQFCDGPDKPWPYWREFVRDYLPDRYTVITGKEGTIT